MTTPRGARVAGDSRAARTLVSPAERAALWRDLDTATREWWENGCKTINEWSGGMARDYRALRATINAMRGRYGLPPVPAEDWHPDVNEDNYP